jgi:hypothetical protein
MIVYSDDVSRPWRRSIQALWFLTFLVLGACGPELEEDGRFFEKDNAEGQEQLSQAAVTSRPNIILLVADDLGYSDIGIFGAQSIKTVHIDQMAREGVRLKSYYAPAPICSPSRAALLTGRYPVRDGWGVALFPTSQTGVDRYTIANKLKEVDYATMAIGK